ncbi:hypothetical protein HH212_07135 [Massilia forsythiae]|uniref:Putative Flp pilus-assembly TadG-like N-terminal domain-containing protein n=1 Tax=Massilia forsythiae TaxID=2728020 RepID=A0A7Z2VVS9_9BURK|nr:TadE/TadG family type IV pilus assembly protein [Massilia forsythiae]QJD99824.1 hypothetical protein HH212_07135 [Massilia forsythiae]
MAIVFKRIPPHILQSLGTRQILVLQRKKSEDGVIAIMTAFVIVIMIAMFGFALDLSRSYNRKMELQSVVDATALAAASPLDGTSEGIDNAVRAAADTASVHSFSYNNGIVTWSPDALTFSTAPDGGTVGWMDSNSAKANAGKVLFARVDTSKLDPNHGRVENILIPVLSLRFAVTDVGATAIAGRDSLNVLPLAICANSATPASSLSSGELIEYGFRRGISYDLIKPNPASTAPQSFLVNPIAPAGTIGASMKAHLDLVAAYVCTGKIAIPTLQGGDITVEQNFPIDTLYNHLNSRFGTYVTPCEPSSASTDASVKSFDLASATWIKAQPSGLSVGPLWSYAKAVKYSSYTTNRGIEPTAGYTTYSATVTDWGTLYPGPPAAQPQSYPSTTPYQTNGGTGAYKTAKNTRVLRVPLLQCPITSGTPTTAKVLGVGRFFMMVPASTSAVYAEFAGIETWAAIRSNTRLYR